MVVVCVLANAIASILGRSINRSGSLSPLAVTTVSMGLRSISLLVTGIVFQGFSLLIFLNSIMLAWLAIVNMAIAFTLWNATLQALAAIESSIINGTMLVQIALLAWIFLDEKLTDVQRGGLVLAGLEVMSGQIRRVKRVGN